MRNVSYTGTRNVACYFRPKSAYPPSDLTKNRDIKPDNILLDEQGHVHLTDFNIAVHYSERKMLTGVAGSMAYMAPEILVKKGYSYTIDWWSLGVCAYELIFGKRPFRGRTNGDLTHSITKDSLRFPEDAEMKCSKQAMQVLAGFLERDVTKRLGCKPDGEGIQDIRAQPWFSSLDWDKLDNKQLSPPFIPDVCRHLFFNAFIISIHLGVYVELIFDHSFLGSLRGQTSMLRTSWKSCFWRTILLRLNIGKKTSPRCHPR